MEGLDPIHTDEREKATKKIMAAIAAPSLKATVEVPQVLQPVLGAKDTTIQAA